jgi:phospholipid/cholesterol/gamma-HCH transport system substrate-binding protein
MKVNKTEFGVGLFILVGLAAMLILAVQIANSSFGQNGESYRLYAKFDNIGGLKPRSPVKVGGVVVGRIEAITLDAEDYMPQVEMRLYEQYGRYPASSSASILTAGLLGEQYVGLIPGFVIEGEDDMLADGGTIEDTKSAIVLEDLIGQFLYSASEK